MPGLGGILGNDFLQQIVLWQIAGAAIGSAMGPYLNALTATVNSASPLAPLSPEAAAEAVLRNVWTRDRAAAEAARSGIDGDRFDALARLAGNAPDPTSLAVALRRGLIDRARYMDGIRQGRLRDEWADLVRELAVQQPSPTAILDAYLEGQVPEGQARDLFAKLGGDPDYFDILYHTQGQAPSPVELGDMANRGIIPWTGTGPDAVSFEQGFLEGPWRNKWLGPMRRAAEYLPPPRTVTAMYNEGTLTRQEAIDLLVRQGLSEQLAAAYVASGSTQKTQASRDLSVSTIRELYRDRLIDRGAAASMLEALGYDSTESGFVLAVVDLEVVTRYVSTAVGRVHTLYTGHKIDQATARAILAQLDVPASNAGELVGVWDLERAANVQVLTAAQVAAGFGLGLLSQAEAQARLEDLGYQPYDAWLYLSIHNKAALPDQPAPSALVPGPGP